MTKLSEYTQITKWCHQIYLYKLEYIHDMECIAGKMKIYKYPTILVISTNIMLNQVRNKGVCTI